MRIRQIIVLKIIQETEVEVHMVVPVVVAVVVMIVKKI